MIPNSPAPRPTRVRYFVLFMLCILAMITYIDRAAYGSVKGDIMTGAGGDKSKAYLLVLMFQIAYALCEIPTGWLGDKYGPRSTLFRVVLWWSICLCLTAAAGLPFPGTDVVIIGVVGILVVQFLFGMGEAGAFPNISKALYNWFPLTQRGFAQGMIWLTARLGGGLTPLLVIVLIDINQWTWRGTLILFSTVGVIWCIAYYLLFRNRPSEHPGVNQAERDMIEADKPKHEDSHSGVPWKKLLLNRNVGFLCGMYFCLNFGWYFVMYFLKDLLEKKFKGDLVNDFGPQNGLLLMGLLAGAPLLLGMAGCLLGGMLTDRYVRRTGDRKWGRRIYAMIGFGGASACYTASLLFLPSAEAPNNVYFFALLIAFAGFFNDISMGSCWAASQDIGRRFAAILGGCMNMIGNLGSVLTIYLTGWIIETRPAESSYPLCLTLYAIAYFLGMLCWLGIDASRSPIEDTSAKG